MENNIKVAKELVKIAKEIVSVYSSNDSLKQIYDDSFIDQDLLYQLQDLYSNFVDKDIVSGVKRHSEIITVVSLSRWLRDNGYEEWTNGKRYKALSELNKTKLSEIGLEIEKESYDSIFISAQKLYEKFDNESRNNHRNFKSSFSSEQELKKVYFNKE